MTTPSIIITIMITIIILIIIITIIITITIITIIITRITRIITMSNVVHICTCILGILYIIFFRYNYEG